MAPTNRFTVALDGPAAAGKGTISKAIAAHFNLAHLDTGLLYRAVGRRVLCGEEAAAAASDLTEADCVGEVLRTLDVGQAASKVSAIPEVRAALLGFQRNFARREGGAVLDGRDIGTVVCPEAHCKLFVTAADETRAHRRHAELMSAGTSVEFEVVLRELRERDARDSQRSTAPLKPAEDAVVLDTSDMGVSEAVAAAIEEVKRKYDCSRR